MGHGRECLSGGIPFDIIRVDESGIINLPEREVEPLGNNQVEKFWKVAGIGDLKLFSDLYYSQNTYHASIYRDGICCVSVSGKYYRVFPDRSVKEVGDLKNRDVLIVRDPVPSHPYIVRMQKARNTTRV